MEGSPGLYHVPTDCTPHGKGGGRGFGAVVKTWLIDASGCYMQSRFDSCILVVIPYYVVVCVLSDRD